MSKSSPPKPKLTPIEEFAKTPEGRFIASLPKQGGGRLHIMTTKGKP